MRARVARDLVAAGSLVRVDVHESGVMLDGSSFR